MAYFALANKAKPPKTIAKTHGRPTRGKAEPEPAAARRSHDSLRAAGGRFSGSWFGEIGYPVLNEKKRHSRH
jgi:hypothetical protein